MVVVAKPIFYIFGKEDGSKFDPYTLMSCQLAGLVSISSSINVVSSTSSLFIGAIATIIFLIVKRILHRIEIDDPLNIVSIHLACGVWGLVAVGIFE